MTEKEGICRMKESEKTAKIFLSHHSSKNELTAHLARYLQKNGLETWYAPRDIRAGEVWDEAIHTAIKECRVMVLLFCAQADSSRQIKRELSLADKYKKPVFWLRIERVEPNNLSYFLTSTQWLDWMDMRDDTLEKLVSDIQSLTAPDGREEEQAEGTREGLRKGGGGERQTVVRSSGWAKGILEFPTNREAAECAARVCFALAEEYPDNSVILPTGRSATLLFRAMVKAADEYEGCPFGEAHIISDTETFGVGEMHETSRTKHVYDMLVRPLEKKGKAPPEDRLHLLSGVYIDGDPVKNAQKLLRLYPPAVHAVSVSPVGEILAYEVGTYNDIDEIIDDPLRIVEVGEHSKKYIDPEQPSKSIVTIGLGTAMAAEVLLILVFDMQKAGILSRMFYGPVTAGIPATLLRNHPNAYVLTTDKIAAEAKVDDMTVHFDDPGEASEWILRQ